MPYCRCFCATSKCNKDFDSYYRNIYDLELPFKVFPAKNTYKVNDTIEFISLCTTIVCDQRTGQLGRYPPFRCPIYVYAGVREETIRRDSSLFDIVVDSTSLNYHTIVSNGQFTSLRANITERHWTRVKFCINLFWCQRKKDYLTSTAYYFTRKIREPVCVMIWTA